MLGTYPSKVKARSNNAIALAIAGSRRSRFAGTHPLHRLRTAENTAQAGCDGALRERFHPRSNPVPQGGVPEAIAAKIGPRRVARRPAPGYNGPRHEKKAANALLRSLAGHRFRGAIFFALFRPCRSQIRYYREKAKPWLVMRPWKVSDRAGRAGPLDPAGGRYCPKES